MKLIDIDDGGDRWTRTFTVELDNGKTFKIEEWSTPSACGTEIYDEDGNPFYDDDLFDEEFMDEYVRPFERAYQARYDAEVQPVIDRIKQEVFGG